MDFKPNFPNVAKIFLITTKMFSQSQQNDKHKASTDANIL